MLTRLSPLTQLSALLRTTDLPLAQHWQIVDGIFREWTSRAELRTDLRRHIDSLSPDEASAVLGRSRETTTHFAWCLLDSPTDPFSVWLHEYKAPEDWREGYADSVHNHRYHFCTTLLRGNYVHERYSTLRDPISGLITSVRLRRSTLCQTGSVGVMYADEFHRIPEATEGTMTFLVKSRPVSESSLSYDPKTGIGHRHVPVEVRLGDLAQRI